MVGNVGENGDVAIIGKGVQPSFGMRKGEVLDMGNLVGKVEEAVRQASTEANVDIGTVYLAVNSGSIETVRNRGSIAIHTQKVTQDDVDEVMDYAKDVAIAQNRRPIHTWVLGYTVDGQSNILRPVGHSGGQLSLDVMVVHVDANCINNLKSIAESVNLDTTDIVFGGFCSAMSVLTPEQKQGGVAVVDIGGGTTKYLVYSDLRIAAAGSIPVGGDHVTNDISLAFNLPQATAEELKLQHGSAIVTGVSSSTGERRIPLSDTFGRKGQSISVKALQTVINARLNEILSLVRSRIAAAGVANRLAAGVVLTGGVTATPGVLDLAKSVFGGAPCSIGDPATTVSGLDGVSNRAAYATIAGLAVYAGKTCARRSGENGGIIRRFFGR